MERRNGPLLSRVASVFAVTSWHLFPQRSKVFLKILERIEISLGSKTTSNKVFVTYERSTCSKSNPLADACFWVSSFISQGHMSVAWVAGAWNSGRKKKRAREKETRVPPSCAPVLSFAHYFQAPATQASMSDQRWFWECTGSLKFFPFENTDCITKGMKFVNLAFFW